MNEKKTVKKRLVLKKRVKSFISRVLITVIIFLVGMILIRKNSDIKNIILENVYDKNFEFIKLKKIYQKYFGDILSVDQLAVNEQAVFQE